MPLDLSSLESDLRRLRPAPLDESLLARLEASTQNAWTSPDPAATRFEHQLRQTRPAPLPPALLDTLEASLRGIPFPGNDIIVPFPRPVATTTRPRRAWWSAAAAVALTGAITALLIPVKHAPANIAGNPPPPRTSQPANPTANLIPAGYNSRLSETRDEGVVWQSNHQPHRVLKVVYRDQVTLKDATGRTYQVEQPRVEYILIPATTD
jgi:hypothetical protein